MDRALGNGIISNNFKELGLFEFREACEWVRALPYKRNSTKRDPHIVLKERCGTCSSKHELIKRLAEENDIKDCKLILCIFKMSGHNTPKVKSLLDDYELSYIPEAHSYITLKGVVHDLTFPENPELLYQNDILHKEEISTDQIQSYKFETHKAYLKNWTIEGQSPYSFEELWSIREACIAALTYK